MIKKGKERVLFLGSAAAATLFGLDGDLKVGHPHSFASARSPLNCARARLERVTAGEKRSPPQKRVEKRQPRGALHDVPITSKNHRHRAKIIPTPTWPTHFLDLSLYL